MLSRDTPTAPLLAPGRVRLGLGVVLAGLLGQRKGVTIEGLPAYQELADMGIGAFLSE